MVNYMVSLKAKAKLTTYGEQKVTESMYHKGRSFINAAILLRRQNGYEYVVLHLLCQGLEIILKSLLLHRDYDKYQPLMRKIGHDLERATNAVVVEFKRKKLSPELILELKELNNLYKNHWLRYGNGFDLLIDPKTISSERTLRRIYSLLKVVDRHISW